MPSKDSKLEKAREVVDILEEISTLLVCVFVNWKRANAPLIKRQNTQLNRSQLSWCVSLIENGVNPEALAASFKLLS
jgi:mitotic-spindle organizing protein 1